jgi:hypothetical protein
MYKWIKRLVASYENVLDQEPKKPTVYKVGGKRWVRTKRISKTTTPKVFYEE